MRLRRPGRFEQLDEPQLPDLVCQRLGEHHNISIGLRLHGRLVAGPSAAARQTRQATRSTGRIVRPQETERLLQHLAASLAAGQPVILVFERDELH